jgi:hypothetical protein
MEAATAVAGPGIRCCLTVSGSGWWVNRVSSRCCQRGILQGCLRESGGPALVAVMQAADLRNPNDVSLRRSFRLLAVISETLVSHK